MGYSNKQRRLITGVMSTCCCSEKVAIDFLLAHDWNPNAASSAILDDGLNNQNNDISEVDEEKVKQWFTIYVDEDSGNMETKGILAFCSDVGIDAEDSVVLVLSHRMEAHKMMVYTSSEFLKGMNSLGCSSVEELKEKIPLLKHNLQNNLKEFAKVYKYTFNYAKNTTGQKTIAMDTTIALWKLLLNKNIWSLTPLWFKFIQEKKKDKKGINKDEWNQLLVFMTKIKVENGKIENFDENGAWPLLLDDFVEYVNA